MRFLLSFLAVALQMPWRSLAQNSTTCVGTNSIHLIAMRGHSFPDDTDTSAWNVLAETRDLVLSSIPGSDAVALPWNYYDPDLSVNVESGRSLLAQYIYSYVKSCPKSYIAVLGYSQATIPMLDIFCGGSEVGVLPSVPIPGWYANNVIAIVAWGDATRLPGMPWNNGTCPSYVAGKSPRFGSVNCLPYAAAIKNVCDSGDLLCCTQSTQDDEVHHAYISKYGPNLVDFIKQRIVTANNKTQTQTQTHTATKSAGWFRA